MSFIFGKSSAEPSLKLQLLRLEMQPLYAGQYLNYSYIVIIHDQLFSVIYYCIGSRCRRII